MVLYDESGLKEILAVEVETDNDGKFVFENLNLKGCKKGTIYISLYSEEEKAYSQIEKSLTFSVKE